MTADLPPPVAGNGQVTLDVVGGPARVEEVTARNTPAVWPSQSRSRMNFGTSAETLRPVCVTPCVVQLTVGPHEMRFSALDDDERTSTDFVRVGTHPVMFRHVMGRRENNIGLRISGIFGVAMGIAALTVGGALFGIGEAATNRDGTPSDSRDSIQRAGAGTLIGGGLLTALSAVVLALSRPVEQPGASTQWTADGPWSAPSQ